MMVIKGFDTLTSLFEYACKGNGSAVDLCKKVWKICHFWDDIIDRDPVTANEVDDAMESALTGINSNEFFLRNPNIFVGMMALIISNWHTSNVYEQSKTDLQKSYMLRAHLYNLPILCAFIIGGQQWANEVSKVVWDSYGEQFEEYAKEIENA